jgi:hypothetical protein
MPSGTAANVHRMLSGLILLPIIEPVSIFTSDQICTYTGIMKDSGKLDRVVAEARRAAALREQGYREQALKIYPWICGRCAREFTRANLRELTVHHRDHNHHNNPPDGSNWELLCLYCHDNEHQRQLEAAADSGKARGEVGSVAKHSPFANLKKLLDDKKPS